MIVGIAIAAGAVLLCTCGYFVVRRRRQGRG
ncbi:LPXTG cell wall anchor domain-containing protein [Streptomyces sp. NBC_00525]|nr:LPXTG cell wall anchor domain-containing protein [Streptomyces sp. NBC_00525]WUC93814.1 LPXTG cell wall anchor domain-containing protein [Streptomyces sp. NBC_00525]